MTLSDKTLEKLRKLINEEACYRSGPELIKFFAEFLILSITFNAAVLFASISVVDVTVC